VPMPGVFVVVSTEGYGKASEGHCSFVASFGSDYLHGDRKSTFRLVSMGRAACLGRCSILINACALRSVGSLSCRDMAQNNRLDFDCKGVVDKIYYAAKAQGKMPWYTDMRGNEQKLHQAVAAYKNKCSPVVPGERSKKIDSAFLMQYLEAVAVGTRVVNYVEGVMMYERQYYNFAETYAGGKLSEEAAQAQWLQWK
jgi:hypothetical protein